MTACILQVPVLVHGQEHVFDSWKIAEYLDEHNPDHLLLGGARGEVQ